MAKIQEIWNELRDGEQLPYVLLDVAGLERGYAQLPLAAFGEIECLFTGDLGDELRDVAPYLARAASFDVTVRDVLAGLMDQQVASLVELRDPQDVSFSQLHRHFRKFNLVYNAEGNPLFFRYHDPRVLLQSLKVFDGTQRVNFFGPVARFTVLQGDDGFVRCSRHGNELALSA